MATIKKAQNGAKTTKKLFQCLLQKKKLIL